MRSLTQPTIALALSCIALAACGEPTPDTNSNNQTTLRLEANSAGDFDWCDADGACQTLSNPGACAVLVVIIDNTSGQTCETCEDPSGNTLSNSCDNTQVECVVVTAPEPDCVVCAYVGGAVIHSTCVTDAPEYCETYPTGGYADASNSSQSGSASTDPTGTMPPFRDDCRVCWDSAGNVILDECPDCSGFICPVVDCAPGFVPGRLPGECCDTCVPADDCADVFCTMDLAVPNCPPATILVRNPADCCGYICEPVECPPLPATAEPQLACANDTDCAPDGRCEAGLCAFPNGGPGGAPCPIGYHRELTFPDCGTCVPDDNTRYCLADSDCNPDETCTVGTECLAGTACGCRDECDASGACYTVCADCVCEGICRPTNWVCPEYASPVVDCIGGTWDFPGRDENGCPLPPACICADGTIAINGECIDQCALLDCPPVGVDCQPGYHLEFGYPYCCGECVPDDICMTMSGSSNFADPCMLIDCGPGSVCEVTSTGCDAICVPGVDYCTSDADCTAGELCSTQWGDCMMPPTCDASQGSNCMTVCAGVCEPIAPKVCTSTSDCTAGQICTTDLGECLSGCGPGMMCPAVCTGTCIDQAPPPTECDPSACGPQLGMPNWICEDGSTGGPTGRCLQNTDGTCGWEINDCI